MEISEPTMYDELVNYFKGEIETFVEIYYNEDLDIDSIVDICIRTAGTLILVDIFEPLELDDEEYQVKLEDSLLNTYFEYFISLIDEDTYRTLITDTYEQNLHKYSHVLHQSVNHINSG